MEKFRSGGMRMVIIRLILAGLLVFNTGLVAGDLISCNYSRDCHDGEVCVSYTGCDTQKNKKQVSKCLTRSCYSLGENCPGSIYCDNHQNCSELRCAKQ